MKKVAIHFATGFEEIEGLAVVDILRRAGVDVNMVSVTDRRMVTGAHDITIVADTVFEEMNYEDIDMIILPGGMPGAANLDAHEGLKAMIKKFDSEEKQIAAICAAPLVLGNLGLLENKKATCYPGFEKYLKGAQIQKEKVVESGRIVTAKGPGAAIEFGLKLVEKLVSKEKSEELRKGMIVD
jgi:4-methyl-5(b-hydroxyethyl)-thiazole monophosphate biosynthesis